MLDKIDPKVKYIEASLAGYNLKEAMLKLIVSIYQVSDKAFDPETFNQLVGLFRGKWDYVLMNTNSACLYSALLSVFYDNPSAQLHPMFELVNIIRETGFRSRISNMMGFALIDGQGDPELVVSRALEIYRNMHEHHNIITGEDDYLAAVYLSELAVEPSKLMEDLETIYRSLSAKSFSKGNPLQTLSHQLMLANKSDIKELALAVNDWHMAFKKGHLKTDGSQILIYGLLAGLALDQEEFFDKIALDDHGKKGLKSIDMTVMILNQAKTLLPEWSTLGQEKRSFVKASLLMMVVAYLFREKLL